VRRGRGAPAGPGAAPPRGGGGGTAPRLLLGAEPVLAFNEPPPHACSQAQTTMPRAHCTCSRAGALRTGPFTEHVHLHPTPPSTSSLHARTHTRTYTTHTHTRTDDHTPPPIHHTCCPAREMPPPPTPFGVREWLMRQAERESMPAERCMPIRAITCRKGWARAEWANDTWP